MFYYVIRKQRKRSINFAGKWLKNNKLARKSKIKCFSYFNSHEDYKKVIMRTLKQYNKKKDNKSYGTLLHFSYTPFFHQKNERFYLAKNI